MRWTAAIIVALTLSSPAHAEFVLNRTAWDGLSVDAQAYYAMGVMDEWRSEGADENKAKAAVQKAHTRCLQGQKISGTALAKLVTEGYAADASWFPYPPRLLVLGQLNKVCASYIEEERAKVGLQPLR